MKFKSLRINMFFFLDIGLISFIKKDLLKFIFDHSFFVIFLSPMSRWNFRPIKKRPWICKSISEIVMASQTDQKNVILMWNHKDWFNYHSTAVELLLYRGWNHLLYQKYIFLYNNRLYLNRITQKANDVTVAASLYRIDSLWKIEESKTAKTHW